MNHKTHKSIGKGVITLALATLFVNAAFADPSADRLSTYKANKLVPDNVSIKVGTEKNSEATFITAQRTWSTPESGNLENLANAFAEWSLEDFQNYGWDQGKEMNEAYFNYLTKVNSG